MEITSVEYKNVITNLIHANYNETTILYGVTNIPAGVHTVVMRDLQPAHI